jgi:hypothetical protein
VQILTTQSIPPKTIRDHAVVVVTGSLNPPAVQPWWLAHLGLIAVADAEAAKIEGVSPEFAVFELSWVRIEILRERFSAAAMNAEADKFRLRDLVVGIFSSLPHTPVTALGINRIVRYEMPDAERFHRIGHTLAPKGFWKEHLKEPGLKSLAIVSRRSDDHPGEINVSVRPVLEVSNVVEVSYNSHFQFPPKSLGKDVVPLLDGRIEATLKEGLVLSNSLIEEVGMVP